MQPDLFRTEPAFDGDTLDPDLDAARLRGQLERVRLLMLDGHWRTLSQIVLHVGSSEAGISARLRDLRKQKFGAYTVNGRRRPGGLWEYQVTR
jgi:hypothetical protein